MVTSFGPRELYFQKLKYFQEQLAQKRDAQGRRLLKESTISKYQRATEKLQTVIDKLDAGSYDDLNPDDRELAYTALFPDAKGSDIARKKYPFGSDKRREEIAQQRAQDQLLANSGLTAQEFKLAAPGAKDALRAAQGAGILRRAGTPAPLTTPGGATLYGYTTSAGKNYQGPNKGFIQGKAAADYIRQRNRDAEQLRKQGYSRVDQILESRKSSAAGAATPDKREYLREKLNVYARTKPSGVSTDDFFSFASANPARYAPPTTAFSRVKAKYDAMNKRISSESEKSLSGQILKKNEEFFTGLGELGDYYATNASNRRLQWRDGRSVTIDNRKYGKVLATASYGLAAPFTYIRTRPLNALGLVATAGALSGVGAGLRFGAARSTGIVGRTFFKGASIGLGAVATGAGAAYFYNVGKNSRRAKTNKERGTIIGNAATETAAFGLGASLGSRAAAPIISRRLTAAYAGKPAAAYKGGLPSDELLVTPVVSDTVILAGRATGSGATLKGSRTVREYGESYWTTGRELADAPKTYRYRVVGQGILSRTWNAPKTTLPASRAGTFTFQRTQEGLISAEKVGAIDQGLTYQKTGAGTTPQGSRTLGAAQIKITYEPVELSNERSLINLFGRRGTRSRASPLLLEKNGGMIEKTGGQLEAPKNALTTYDGRTLRTTFKGYPVIIERINAAPSGGTAATTGGVSIVDFGNGLLAKLKTKTKPVTITETKPLLAKSQPPTTRQTTELFKETATKPAGATITRTNSRTAALSKLARAATQSGKLGVISIQRGKSIITTKRTPVTIARTTARYEFGLGSIQTPKIASATKTTTKTTTTTKTATRYQFQTSITTGKPWPGLPGRPPKTPELPRLPLFKLPSSNGSQRGGITTSNQQLGYTPSAYALAFNIKGAKPSKGALKTGLGIRPILTRRRRRSKR